MAVILTILLTILKIIAVLLLTILGIILLVLAIVLFVPVRYQIAGEFEEKKGGEAGVSWLGPIVKVKGGYYLNEELFYHLKVFGLLILTSGDEKTILTRLSDWKEKRERKKREKEQKKREKEKKDNNIEANPEPLDDFASYAEHAEHAEYRDYDDYFNNNYPAKPLEKEKAKSDEGTDPYAIGYPQADAFDYDFAEEDDKESLKEKIDRIKTTIKNACVKAGEFIISAKNKTDEFYEKVEDGMDKLHELEVFYYENESQHTVKKLVRVIKKTILYVLPTKGRGYVDFGFSDPSMTGRIYGILCGTGIAGAKTIKIIPEFQETKFQAKLDVKGRLRAFYFVRMALYIVLDKKVRNVYKKGKKVIGHE